MAMVDNAGGGVDGPMEWDGGGGWIDEGWAGNGMMMVRWVGGWVVTNK